MELFGPTPDGGIGPLVRPEDRALAAALPPRLRLGTSSWSFPGWRGIVYDRKATQQALSREGLRAYAANPLHRTVGVDRSHYQPLPAAQWRRWAEQVPEDFRFLVKAHEHCTLATFPGHARYGTRRHQPNERYLDPHYAAEAVIGPTLEGLGGKLGVVLFQFAPQELGPPQGFAERLHGFLSRLPKGPAYAVEVRTPQVLGDAYSDALASTGALHCLNLLGGMPDLATQLRLTPAARAPGLVVRWMLRRELSYEQAKALYHPFDRLAQPDDDTLEALAAVLETLGKPALVIANNKAEGCSPLTLRRLAERLTACPPGRPGPC